MSDKLAVSAAISVLAMAAFVLSTPAALSGGDGSRSLVPNAEVSVSLSDTTSHLLPSIR